MRTDLLPQKQTCRLLIPALLVGVLWLTGSAHAQQRLEKRFPTSANPNVALHSENAQVKIKGWSRAEVRMVAMPGSAAQVVAEQKSNRVEIITQVTRAGASPAQRSVNYEIMAPEEASLHVHCDAGSVQIENIRGDVSVESVTAPIVLHEIEGHTSVKTMSANVTAERYTGRLEARSLSGHLKFKDSSAPSLTANTTSGSIYFDGALLHGGNYSFTNYSGPIELVLSPDDSFELKADSIKGVVESEIPLQRPRASRAIYSPRTPGVMQSLVGTHGAGEASVQASSFSGTIKIRKR